MSYTLLCKGNNKKANSGPLFVCNHCNHVRTSNHLFSLSDCHHVYCPECCVALSKESSYCGGDESEDEGQTSNSDVYLPDFNEMICDICHIKSELQFQCDGCKSILSKSELILRELLYNQHWLCDECDKCFEDKQESSEMHDEEIDFSYLDYAFQDISQTQNLLSHSASAVDLLQKSTAEVSRLVINQKDSDIDDKFNKHKDGQKSAHLHKKTMDKHKIKNSHQNAQSISETSEHLVRGTNDKGKATNISDMSQLIASDVNDSKKFDKHHQVISDARSGCCLSENDITDKIHDVNHKDMSNDNSENGRNKSIQNEGVKGMGTNTPNPNDNTDKSQSLDEFYKGNDFILNSNPVNKDEKCTKDDQQHMKAYLQETLTNQLEIITRILRFQNATIDNIKMDVVEQIDAYANSVIEIFNTYKNNLIKAVDESYKPTVHRIELHSDYIGTWKKALQESDASIEKLAASLQKAHSILQTEMRCSFPIYGLTLQPLPKSLGQVQLFSQSWFQYPTALFQTQNVTLPAFCAEKVELNSKEGKLQSENKGAILHFDDKGDPSRLEDKHALLLAKDIGATLRAEDSGATFHFKDKSDPFNSEDKQTTLLSVETLHADDKRVKLLSDSQVPNLRYNDKKETLKYEDNGELFQLQDNGDKFVSQDTGSISSNIREMLLQSDDKQHQPGDFSLKSHSKDDSASSEGKGSILQTEIEDDTHSNASGSKKTKKKKKRHKRKNKHTSSKDIDKHKLASNNQDQQNGSTKSKESDLGTKDSVSRQTLKEVPKCSDEQRNKSPSIFLRNNEEVPAFNFPGREQKVIPLSDQNSIKDTHLCEVKSTSDDPAESDTEYLSEISSEQKVTGQFNWLSEENDNQLSKQHNEHQEGSFNQTEIVVIKGLDGCKKEKLPKGHIETSSELEDRSPSKGTNESKEARQLKKPEELKEEISLPKRNVHLIGNAFSMGAQGRQVDIFRQKSYKASVKKVKVSKKNSNADEETTMPSTQLLAALPLTGYYK